MLKDWSLKSKLLFIILLVSGVAITLACISIVTFYSYTYKNDLIVDIQIQAEITGLQCASTLDFIDPQAATDTLKPLDANENISAAYLFDADGFFFASYIRNKTEDIQSPIVESKEQFHRFTNDRLEIHHSIISAQEQIGTIILYYDLSAYHSRIWQILGTSLSMILVVFVITYLVANRLQNIILIPILNLSNTAKEISENKNYSLRAKVFGKDELGHLIEVFNDMLNRIQKRDAELIHIQNDLENRVTQRTMDLQKANEKIQTSFNNLKQTQRKLVQSEKMASLGQLVAGVAHEINNPVNYIISNIEPLKEYILGFKESYSILIELREQLSPQDRKRVDELIEKHDLEFANEDIEKILTSYQEGSNRIAQIVLDLRQYSQADKDYFSIIDIHKSIDSTLNLLHSKVKYNITVHKEYGNVPQIKCSPGQMGQVFMNVLNNAVDAIGDQGNIWINTSLENNQVSITIRDDGEGIPKDIHTKIFDPFFTTKPVGTGTGLGLSITHTIIEKHQGNIAIESEEGKGTTFKITLPIDKEVEKPG